METQGRASYSFSIMTTTAAAHHALSKPICGLRCFNFLWEKHMAEIKGSPWLPEAQRKVGGRGLEFEACWAQVGAPCRSSKVWISFQGSDLILPREGLETMRGREGWIEGISGGWIPWRECVCFRVILLVIQQRFLHFYDFHGPVLCARAIGQTRPSSCLQSIAMECLE